MSQKKPATSLIIAWTGLPKPNQEHEQDIGGAIVAFALVRAERIRDASSGVGRVSGIRIFEALQGYPRSALAFGAWSMIRRNRTGDRREGRHTGGSGQPPRHRNRALGLEKGLPRNESRAASLRLHAPARLAFGTTHSSGPPHRTAFLKHGGGEPPLRRAQGCCIGRIHSSVGTMDGQWAKDSGLQAPVFSFSVGLVGRSCA